MFEKIKQLLMVGYFIGFMSYLMHSNYAVIKNSGFANWYVSTDIKEMFLKAAVWPYYLFHEISTQNSKYSKYYQSSIGKKLFDGSLSFQNDEKSLGIEEKMLLAKARSYNLSIEETGAIIIISSIEAASVNCSFNLKPIFYDIKRRVTERKQQQKLYTDTFVKLHKNYKNYAFEAKQQCRYFYAKFGPNAKPGPRGGNNQLYE